MSGPGIRSPSATGTRRTLLTRRSTSTVTTRRSAAGSSPTNCEQRSCGPGDNRVARLCSQQQLWSVFSKKAGPPVHDDLVRRQFAAAGPDQLLLTDITEHATAGGKAVPVRDQRRVV